MKRQITRTWSAEVRPLSPEQDPGAPLFAINWIRVRAHWLYNLYTALASKSVESTGGRALFKGTVERTLLGNADFARDVLLIVNYPSSSAFLDLVKGRFFRVVSVLRMAAVRDFSFVFNRLDEATAMHSERLIDAESKFSWGALVYQSSAPLAEEVAVLDAAAQKDEVTVALASEPTATFHMYDEAPDGEGPPLDFVTDRVILLRAPSEALLTQAAQGELGAMIAGMSSGWLGLMHRTI